MLLTTTFQLSLLLKDDTSLLELDGFTLQIDGREKKKKKDIPQTHSLGEE